MNDIKFGKFTADATAVYVEVGFVPEGVQISNMDTPAIGLVDVEGVNYMILGTGAAVGATLFEGGELPAASKVVRARGQKLLTKLLEPLSPAGGDNNTDGETIETVPAGTTYFCAEGFYLPIKTEINVNTEVTMWKAERGS
jgi:hypothetical protein